MELLPSLLSGIVGAGLSYALLKNQLPSAPKPRMPQDELNEWNAANDGFCWEKYCELVSPFDNIENFTIIFSTCIELKNIEKHYEALILFIKIKNTIKKLDKSKDSLGCKIQNYIDSDPNLCVIQREAVQLNDLMDAFFNNDGWTNDDVLTSDVQYSYRQEGRRLRSRKFIKVINKPMKNLVMRTAEIDQFSSWKWYQTGKTVDPCEGTNLCSIVSVLSRFVVLNRAAYCWKLNYFLPDGSCVVSYNGANNRQSDYNLPPLPKGFAYPDIFYHAWRFIPVSKNKTIVVSVMESDPKIWFMPTEGFVRTAKKFGCRELALLDQYSNHIRGTVYDEENIQEKSIYQTIDQTVTKISTQC
ncbi:hypothetical protein CYY_005044 [Polysphondylium violaceum]|uniref:Uncharacterized protein n=1 Tax=Polysphondylium violaceum TaxID=133409 RepID=A0A8J4PX76_9MYCE|nr:hypothetical protein CYY_005044 [Polysphondylium violaceum]